MRELLIRNENETRNFGIQLGNRLKKGDIVCLTGDLGTGKTTLAKAIAEGLLVEEAVTSPTFAIIHEYAGRIPVYHFDVYRINDIDEMYELGYEEYFFGDGVCIVEWADIIRELIPEGSIFINIEYGKNEDERIYRIANYEF